MLHRLTSSMDRRLALILIAAVLIRLPVAVALGNEVTVMPAIHDQLSYDALAQSLLAGRGYSFETKWYPFTPAHTPTAHWSFIYPLFLAGVYGVAGYHPLVARIAQAALAGALICWLLYLIGRRVANHQTGLAAAGLAAVYGYFLYYSAALMTETFFIVFVLWAVYLGLAIQDRPTLTHLALLGVALGMGILLRQTLLFFAAAFTLWLFVLLRSRGLRWWQSGLPALIVAVMVAPWTIRNYVVYDHFLLLNSNAGYALFASNNPKLETDWRNEVVVVPVPAELVGQNEAELDRALTRIGFGYILADPQRYLLLTLDRSQEFFRFWPTAESSPISNLNRVLSFGLYLPLMLLGLGLSLPHWRRYQVLYLFVLVHTGLHLLTWPSPRYRLPVDAVLMVFASLAVLELARRLVTWRRSASRELPIGV